MIDSIGITQSNIRDDQFGLQLLGDYARFIRDALSAQETVDLDQAQKYIALFDGLLVQSKQNLSSEQLKGLNQQAYDAIQNFRIYILNILRRQISEYIAINLNPQSLNMMVNTTELLLDGLNSYMHNQFPDTSTLSSTWLQNIYINTLNIQDQIGSLYFEERAKAGQFANIFLNLSNKSLILDGLRRTGLKNFPALNQFYNQMQTNLIAYAEYLVDLMNLIKSKEYVGKLSLLYVDSMYRRVCFFMTQLSRISTIPVPACDPTSPRRT